MDWEKNNKRCFDFFFSGSIVGTEKCAWAATESCLEKSNS